MVLCEPPAEAKVCVPGDALEAQETGRSACGG